MTQAHDRAVAQAGARLQEFASAIETAQDWVADLTSRLGWREYGTAHRALVACLHALRDSLPRDAAIFLGLGLPVLIRGFYFDGWRPAGRQAAAKTRRGFLGRIHDGVDRDPAVEPEQVAYAVLALLADRLPKNELENARAATPAALHAYWPG